MQVSENFMIEEFVPETVYNEYLALSTQFVDRRLIRLCEKLRMKLKTELMINTWQYSTEQLTNINTKFKTNYDLVNRLTQRAYINPATTTDLTTMQQMAGRACIFDAIGLTQAEVLVELLNNFGNYRLFGLTNAKLVGTSIYMDVRQMTLNDNYPMELTVISE